MKQEVKGFRVQAFTAQCRYKSGPVSILCQLELKVNADLAPLEMFDNVF